MRNCASAARRTSAATERAGDAARRPPATTASGALLTHITGGPLAAGASFQPMNVNSGLFPPLAGSISKGERRATLVARARADLGRWLDGERTVVPTATNRPATPEKPMAPPAGDA